MYQLAYFIGNFSNFRSGIEVIVTELDDLLQQILILMKEFQRKKIKSALQSSCPDNEKTSYQKGYEAREQSCSFGKSTVSSFLYQIYIRY